MLLRERAREAPAARAIGSVSGAADGDEIETRLRL